MKHQLLIEHSFKNVDSISHHEYQLHWIDIKRVLEMLIRAGGPFSFAQ